jgi:hypothetical protein
MLRPYHMEPKMSRPHPSAKRESTRTWLSGLAITITTLVCLFGFWRLSPGVTFIVACLALAVLSILLWVTRREPS